MLIDEAISPPSQDTVRKARTLRDEYAMAAAAYAYRIEHARASERVEAVSYWTAEYRRSVARCRMLGQIIRGERKAGHL